MYSTKRSGRALLSIAPPPSPERAIMSEATAAKLRVTDEAARKGRQRDPGLPDKVVHILWADRRHGSEVQT
jgi:hypothetical protein